MINHGASDLQEEDASWPVMMRPTEIIGMKQAVDLVQRDAKTITRWCLDYGIGVHSTKSAPWEISSPALLMVRHGDFEALRILKQGNRQHPRVARYFLEVGAPT
jgi:hypothetical protein